MTIRCAGMTIDGGNPLRYGSYMENTTATKTLKTKRAAQSYNCHACKGTIQKGEQYGKTSVPFKSTIHPAGQDAPSWAWETVRIAFPICVPCIATR